MSALPDIDEIKTKKCPFYKMEVAKFEYAEPEALQRPLSSLSAMPSSDPFTTLRLPLDAGGNRLLKRSIDLCISTIVTIALLSWLIPIIALLVKLTSKGPVFFLQTRNKKDGETFTCIKFRSMLVNNDAHVLPAKENDRRITKFGGFLRKYYLDELPQFLNVLMGDMSLVGPRPHMVSENIKFQEIISYYNYREKVKPGITGLSQTMGLVGRADTFEKIKDRTDVDIYYMRHWSIKMDCVILYRTIRNILGQK